MKAIYFFISVINYYLPSFLKVYVASMPFIYSVGSNVRLFQNEYIKYGTSFSQYYKKIEEYEYAKPVTGVPKLLLNTFQKSYKSWK